MGLADAPGGGGPSGFARWQGGVSPRSHEGDPEASLDSPTQANDALNSREGEGVS